MNISWKCIRNAAIFSVILWGLIFWGVSAWGGEEALTEWHQVEGGIPYHIDRDWYQHCKIDGPKAETLEQEVTKALELALKYLPTSWGTMFFTLEYVTPAEQLRRRADEIEQKDADIEYIKDVFQRWKEYQKKVKP